MRATDQAGNADSTPASRSFTVDATAPETTITSGPSGATSNRTPSFGFGSTEAGSSFECRLDSGAWAACTSPRTTAALADGAHSFDVRATDQAGNVDPTPASRSFTVDATAPETTITSGPSGATSNRTPSFGFGSTEAGSSFECRLDSGAWAACTSPRTTAALADGAHSFDVRATDQAGNVDPTPAYRRFKVDTHRPISTAAGPASSSGSPFRVRYAASDASPSSGLVTVALWVHRPGQTGYSKAATDATPNTTRFFSYRPLAGAGTYRYFTRANDRARNQERPPATADAATVFTP